MDRRDAVQFNVSIKQARRRAAGRPAAPFHETDRRMDVKRTYFLQRLDAAALDQLIAQRVSFFLEDVADVDATATQMARTLEAQGLACQVRDRRAPLLDEATSGLVPWWAALPALAGSILQAAAHRLARPRPHVVIVQSARALDVRFHARAAGVRAARA